MTLSSKARSVRARKRRFDEFVETAAWYAGWAGVAMLAGCAILWLLPGDSWDGTLKLRADRLPLYAMVALLLASLVGWGYVNIGENRLKKNFGKHLNLALFVVLPLACIAAGMLKGWITDQTGWHSADHPFWLFVRWYPPLLVVVCAGVFISWKARPRKHVYLERGLGYLLLLVPYAMLFAFLELGIRLEWLDGPLRDTFSALGQYSVALQLVMAYFIGGD